MELGFYVHLIELGVGVDSCMGEYGRIGVGGAVAKRQSQLRPIGIEGSLWSLNLKKSGQDYSLRTCG